MTPPRRRLLVLVPFPPRSDAPHGGARVIAELLSHLVAKHDVACLYLRSPREEAMDEELARGCALAEEVRRPDGSDSRPAAAFRAARLGSAFVRGRPVWVEDWNVRAYARRVGALVRTWAPDIVQIEFHVMAQYVRALAGAPAPRVLTVHEPGADAARDRWSDEAGVRRVLRRADLSAWIRYERERLADVDALVCFTERDRNALERLGTTTPIHRIPFGLAVPAVPLDPVGAFPPNLVFVGNFVHPPNVDAATRLVRAILPALEKRHPDISLSIVGEDPAGRARAFAGGAVTVTGRVDDVTPYLDRAALVVLPLRLGGGMRVKLLDALAAGKAVVASPLAAEGLDVVDGEHLRLAESDGEFAAAVDELLGDETARAGLARRAREWALANASGGRAAREYAALYETLLGKRASAGQAA
ncbi:MAG: glycosyltransferase [Thermoleophilia bacterium]|nr:glycosyltransferase [Thermoleophilia bacterium]